MKTVADFEKISRRALTERGFYPDFSKAVLKETASLPKTDLDTSVRDLRHLLWCSIDNDDSLDLDQLTFAEEGKIYVAVAHVASLVKRGSAVDQHAEHNTTSIYTPGKIYPMLPTKFSNDLTSLNPHKDRNAYVIEVDISSDGRFSLGTIYPALVHNQAKLTYKEVALLIEHNNSSASIDQVEGLKHQLFLQDILAQRIKTHRVLQGALFFASTELVPVITDINTIQLKESEENRAHQLIENFMISANFAMTQFFNAKKLPILRRVVKTPKRWDRIVMLAASHEYVLPSQPDREALQAFLKLQQAINPAHFPDLCLAIIKLIGRGEYTLDPTQGHFDLGLKTYAHTTAPNRRFPDLIMQRIMQSHFDHKALPYSRKELARLALHCTEKETDAEKVERRLIKSAAAFSLQTQIGKRFEAIVTGSSPKGTWVRLKTPPLEGKLVEGYEGVDVGDLLEVELISVHIVKGHIDFRRVSKSGGSDKVNLHGAQIPTRPSRFSRASQKTPRRRNPNR